MIPKILHQTWKTRRIPRRFRGYVASWSKYQQLEYRFYTDQDLRRLIAEHYPQYLALYDSFDRNIERADFGRYAILHRYGGIYADLDMECLRSIEPLLESAGPIVGTEPIEHAHLYRVQRLLCNAILFSPVGHPLWPRFMEFIAKNYRHGGNVVYNTGPAALSLLGEQCPELFLDVRIAEPNWFYPLIDPRFGGKTEGRFRNVSETCRIADAYAAHHWVHTYDTWQHRLKTTIREQIVGLRRHFQESPCGNFDRRFFRGPLQPAEIRRDAVAALRHYDTLMRDHRVDSWLMYRTLLAWQQDRGFAAGGKNIELGVHYNDLYRMRLIRFDDPRYLLDVNPNHTRRSMHANNRVDARFIDKTSGLFLDIYGYHLDDDLRHVADKRGGFYLRGHVFPLQPCRFEGMDMLRPSNPRAVLEAEYGNAIDFDRPESPVLSEPGDEEPGPLLDEESRMARI